MLSAYRFDVHSLAVVLPFVILVTTGLTASVLTLTDNSFTASKGGFTVKAWWDGDHADLWVKASHEAPLPARLTVLEPDPEKPETYRLSPHVWGAVTLDSPDKAILIHSISTDKQLLLLISTHEAEFRFEINLD